MKTLEDVIEILICPSTGQRLSLADTEQLSRINQKISSSEVRTIAGTLVTEALTVALITEDHSRVYPVQHEIASLLADEAIIVRPLR